MNALDAIPVPAPLQHMRRYALDGALLLFDRHTGWTALCDGEETAHLRMTAPRVVQFAITNACNLACKFCSRPLDARSEWTAQSAFEYLAALADAGTLEVAFGGWGTAGVSRVSAVGKAPCRGDALGGEPHDERDAVDRRAG